MPSRAGSPQQEQQPQLSEDDNKPGPSKKARIASPRPVVMDDMEIEAKREVPASAGLQGAAVEASNAHAFQPLPIDRRWVDP